AAHHHLVVHAARTVVVEIDRLHAECLQVQPGGGARLDVAYRTDVVRGNRVAENGERPRTFEFTQSRVRPTGFEEWRLLDVGGIRLPGVLLAGIARHAFPERVGDGVIHTVDLAVLIGARGSVEHLHELILARPDVFQENRLAILAGAERLFRHVDVHSSGD